jgi:lipoprotein-releasing system ATP-binding protein
VAEVLRLEGVTKSFNIGTPVESEVLHGIDVTMAAGEFCALIGRSGSGKSTLLNLIGLLDRPTSGQIFIEGDNATQMNDVATTRLRGRSLGFVFQFHHLISAFTALENVMMPMLAQRGFPDREMRESATALLDSVGLADRRDYPANQLSGGQQQRVAIARALISDPALVLADEPTGNLDTKATEEVFELMRTVNRERGTTFLIVTHSLDLAARCDRILEVEDGYLKR